MKPQTVKEYLEQNPTAVNGPFIEINPKDEFGDRQFWRVRINGHICKPSFLDYAAAARYFAKHNQA